MPRPYVNQCKCILGTNVAATSVARNAPRSTTHRGFHGHDVMMNVKAAIAALLVIGPMRTGASDHAPISRHAACRKGSARVIQHIDAASVYAPHSN